MSHRLRRKRSLRRVSGETLERANQICLRGRGSSTRSATSWRDTARIESGLDLGTDGGTDDVAADRLPALAVLYREFVADGGHVWLCGACTKPRGIGESDSPMALVGAARVVDEIVIGARTVAVA